jgi:YbbR domain-containing protein
MAMISRWVKHNFGWKLASLLAAVMLWVISVGKPELVTIQAVPVLYGNLPKGLLVVSDAPDSVRVELRGPTLTRSDLENVFASLDLSGVAGPGEQTFTLSSKEVSLPQGVVFLRAVPSQLRLRFDRGMTRDVPVTIRLQGMPPAGYRIAGQQIIPGRLSVSGPEELVKSIASAETDLIDVSGMIRTTETKVNAFVAERRVQFESSPVVTVRLSIEQTSEQTNEPTNAAPNLKTGQNP